MRIGSGRRSVASLLFQAVTATAIALLSSVSIASAAAAVPLPRPKPLVAEWRPQIEREGRDGARSTGCIAELRKSGMVAEAAAGFLGSGRCVVTDPVRIDALQIRAGKVTFPARPIVDCPFAAVLAAWAREIVAPAAAALMDSPVEAILTGPGYECRARNRAAGAKLSEHGVGHAIDIVGLELADGRRVLVESLVGAQGAERELLDGMATSACGYFTTVLGPGSDAAHADHLHLDVAQRKSRSYRICMAR